VSENTDYAPFESIPGGQDIALYFIEDTDRRNRGCDGIDLWRDGRDYCYLWVEAMVDYDLNEFYLLDIRTSQNGTETRDFLYVACGFGMGGQSGVECEWHQQPINFSDTREAHVARSQAGLKWFIDHVNGDAETAWEGTQIDRSETDNA
jgi:hypothetical protein